MKKIFLCILVQCFMCVCFANLSNAALRNLPWGLEWGDSIQKVAAIVKNKYPSYEYITLKDNPNRKVLKASNIEYGQSFSTFFGTENGKLTDISLSTIISNQKNNLLAAKNIAHNIIDTVYEIKKYYKLENNEPWGDGRRYTFTNNLTKLQFTYGTPRGAPGMAGLIITFQPLINQPKTSVKKNIYDYIATMPIHNASLPFGFKWGEAPTKVESVLKKECLMVRSEKNQYDKNILTYSAAIKSDIFAAIICGFNSNSLDTLVFYMLIENTGNNKNISDDILKFMNTKCLRDMGGKTISYSFTDDRNSMLFLLPYALMDIISEKVGTEVDGTKDKDAWLFTIKYKPIPADVPIFNKEHSLEEIKETLNELKK